MKQMAAEEIIVLDEGNDDLEEGEITDDVVPEVEILVQSKVKPKQLPCRYSLHDKSSNGRHKICKHKEKSKFQSPSKLETVHRKKHKSSCPRHSFEKHRLKRKEVHHSYDSSAIKSAFRNYTSPPRVPPFSRKLNSYQNTVDEVSFPKLLSEYKKAKKRLTQKSENVRNNHQDKNSQKKESEQLVNDAKKSNISPAKQNLCEKLPVIDLTEEKNEKESDEEDVEELRRIALATCAKKPTAAKIGRENSIEISNSSSSNASSSPTIIPLIHSIETFHANCDNDPRDNYDVVDMDLDDDGEATSQNVCHNDLFVIDKTPAVTEFTPNCLNDQLSKSIQEHSVPEVNENNLPQNHSEPIDDFEELLLRAEVIASMNSNRQKQQSPPTLTPVEEKMSEIIAKVDMLHNEVNSLHNGMRPKPLCSIYPKGPLKKSVIPPQKRIIDAKSAFSNFKNNKITASPPPRGVNTVQERLIITLNNDTTTDESEEEETNTNVSSQNNVPVSSIEALISSARQKSDEAQLSSESSNNVSCLSKAQQEEYNSLKKLLAEKTQYSISVPLVKEKNQADQSRINLLAKKISVAKANLEKEIGMRSEIQKELLEKKRNYMASKLRVQMLKEKLHAAEKIRAANLENWKQCSAKLDVVKKSVFKRETLLKSLETELNTKNANLESKPTVPAV